MNPVPTPQVTIVHMTVCCGPCAICNCRLNRGCARWRS
ncbi:MAG: hypothetical protein E6J73_05885 [Deltaproteobacteria bacterium]|nr:MAG: hypothetical protein E6J73_05885 [Deltaproteobacteria bacterium]